MIESNPKLAGYLVGIHLAGPPGAGLFLREDIMGGHGELIRGPCGATIYPTEFAAGVAFWYWANTQRDGESIPRKIFTLSRPWT